MSYEAMHKVRASGLTDRTQVDVLEALAFFLNKETGACFPSTESIARIARLSPNIARRAIKELEEDGYISTNQKPGGKRHFVLYLNRLPVGCLTEEGVSHKQGGAYLQGVSEPTGGSEVKGGSEVTALPCQKCDSSPVRSESTPLSDLTPEQGTNKESNKVSNKVYDAPAPSDLFDEPVQMVEKPKKTNKKGTRLTTEVLPEEWRIYCEENAPDIDPQKAFEDFHDYWVGVPGARGVKLDWFATWRNFLRGIPDWKRKNLVKPKKNTGRLDMTSDEYLEIYRRGCTYDPNSEPSPTDSEGFAIF